MNEKIIRKKLGIIVSSPSSEGEKVDKIVELIKSPDHDIDICLIEGCDSFVKTNYRLCIKHLAEAHAEGFDDSNK